MAIESGNNFYNAVRGAMGLFGNTNKGKKLDGEDTPDSPMLPEFESKMSEDEINKLTAQWISADQNYTKEIQDQQKDNVNYWIGKQYNDFQTAGTKKPLVDNLIFESLETFLPIATRGNPEANVYGDGTEEGEKISRTITKAMAYQANRQKLRMKLKATTRNWALYMIGAVKVNWDAVENDIDTEVILPSRLILDPTAKIDVCGFYKGEYIGEKKRATATKLIQLFPSKSTLIKEMAQDNLGTKLTYIEWWTRTDVFFTIESRVLGKYKNPHWNYSGTNTIKDPETGAEMKEEVEGQNHFSQPEFPYLFLTIFNTGKRPHDDTSLIGQNLALQDNINKRYQQIDRNVDAQNNGIVLSGKSFTKEQAAEAGVQLSRGNPLWVPDGNISESYVRDSAPQISGDIMNQLTDSRNELRNIFGTSGSSPQGIASEDTARGKIMVNQLDSSRIGGGVTEYIEQLASGLYNWYMQMMYVWYTDEHTFSILGPKAQELLTIKNTDFRMKFHILVKDGSLIPKDPLTKRNEAMDLWSAQAIDPISLYTALDYPNPYEAAKSLLIWQMIEKGGLPPTALFPDFQMPQPQGQPGQPGQPAPGVPTSPGVSGQEAQAEVNPVPPIAPTTTSQQLMASVPTK